MKKLFVLVIAIVLFAASASILAKPEREGLVQVTATQAPTENVFGTIQYDPGAPQDLFRGFSGTNQSVGNIFNSAVGSPLKSGNVTAVTFFPIAVGGDVIATVWGAPTGGGNAANLGTFAVTGVVNSTFNSAAIPSVSVGPTFMAGIYIGTFGSGPDSLGMRTASTNGQGFHAMQINFLNATSGSGFATIAGQNAMVRASGDVLVPVELMSFSIE